MHRFFSLLLAGTLLPALLAAQEFTVTPLAHPRPKDPTYKLPLVPTRTVRFTTDEGTWMSLDVSPNGKTIVFDLLGDLYTVPIEGGQATRIMGGMAIDVQPRYSPDGSHIVFVSDRTGSDNAWIADADGRNPRPLLRTNDTSTSSGFFGSPITQPVWSPDGQYIVASGKLFNIAGGAGVAVRGLGASEVAFGGDKRYAYFPGGGGGGGGGAISVYDFTTGRATVRVKWPRLAIRPAVSPDNHWLVYVTREDMKTALRLRDLRTGDDSWLARDIQHDASGRSAALGKFPGYAFTPDSKAIVISDGGKLWRIDVPSGQRAAIPFHADVEQDLGPLSRFQYAVHDTFTARQIRDPRLSPDGKRLAFIALDKTYLMDFPNGTPRRVSSFTDVVELAPAWSPDGRSLAFATYSDLGGGHIYRVDVSTSAPGAPQRVTTKRDLYMRLAWSPDGSRLVFTRLPWQQQQAFVDIIGGGSYTVDLSWVSAAGGEPRRIMRLSNGGRLDSPAWLPHFLNGESDRVVVADGHDLVSVRWDGTDRRTVVKSGDAAAAFGGSDTPMILSPDGTRAVVIIKNNIYTYVVPPGRYDSLKVIAAGADANVPARRITRVGGEFPNWTADGRTLYYALGRTLFLYDVAAADAAVADSVQAADRRHASDTLWNEADSARIRQAIADTAQGAYKVAYEPTRFDIRVVVPREKPHGTVVLRGARLVTMKGHEVIEQGDIVVRDDRIVAIGPQGKVAIPAGARTIDVTGKTIIPGYVDVHAHIWPPWQAHKTQVPQYLANLAYGVTTTRDPQTQTSDVITYGDRVESGDLIGPRVFATGPGIGLPSGDPFHSLADARDVVTRYADYYETETLKQYLAGNRKVRQWVIMATRESHITPTTEGAGDFKMSLSEMLDGYSGHEHAYEIYPVYRDIALLSAASGIMYTPTLLVAYGGPEGKNHWFASDNPHDDPKVRRFFAHRELDNRSLTRNEWMPEDQYITSGVAAGAAKIVAAGGMAGLGSHGEFQGLGAHWELLSLGSGGMPPHDVLRSGTIFGAISIGLDRELGSLEVGKLADLQVLDKNPLDKLDNIRAMRYVMKNGRLYDAATMDEVWPRQKKLDTQWWWTLDPPGSGTRAK